MDLIELNEAFAVQAVAITRELDLDPERLNVNGGAVALGHAIGQSGSRLLTTMLYEMKRRDAHRGLVALMPRRRKCGGAGSRKIKIMTPTGHNRTLGLLHLLYGVFCIALMVLATIFHLGHH